jgi:hypothetical protein
MDRTSSKIGQQHLYNRLITIDKNINFESREKLVELIDKNEGNESEDMHIAVKTERTQRSGDICLVTREMSPLLCKISKRLVDMDLLPESNPEITAAIKSLNTLRIEIRQHNNQERNPHSRNKRLSQDNN